MPKKNNITNLKIILIFGASASKIPFMEAARSLSYTSVAFDVDPKAPGRQHADLYYEISLYDVDAIQTVCTELSARNTICGIIAYTSNAEVLKNAGKIADMFKLAFASDTALHCMADKVMMKRRFSRAGISMPDGIVYDDPAQIEKSAGEINYPVVIKPTANSVGSRGVSLASSLEELYAGATGLYPVLVEQYAVGRLINVGGIACGSRKKILSIVEKITNRDTGFLPRGYRPYACNDPAFRTGVEAEVVKAVDALEISDSFFSVDLIAQDTICRIIEAGILLDAKLDRLLWHSGIDIYRMACFLAVGIEPVHAGNSMGNKSLEFVYTDGGPSHKDSIFEEEHSGRYVTGCPESVADIRGWEIFPS